ncbi:PREDICTED: structural maintenance of chromosomes protein 2 [Nicrophorus vespilloides]|uniref:Structural maintenance of chromosomes protein n=1 Tax=Nicrophorus vespilloides TaxID=110193 RepID=A0ABM1MUY0_NICVS|nr:PREDICTED: structural maintenance of chromosomes protein 2 [Nicrophorus vespilloides]
MYIKNMVLDGFKSYGKRVEINGFDKEFNAITGLNGTGKSNILDGICFLLGITNLGHVRAASLQDLIFKNGQAGVTKATVSVTFDNSDRAQSPSGFENMDEITVTRQVIMGGKNKYMINGSIVQNKRVQDLFCSVQLNVNNPHFLIMQGRVTKVLNMKPPEILAMLEEAAGTRMYETKRQSTQKCIERKDAKLNELQGVISEELNPKLQKLRNERQAYLEYQRVARELEHMTNLYQSWLFFSSKKKTVMAQEKLSAYEGKVSKIKENIEGNVAGIAAIMEEVQELSTRNEAEGSNNVQILEERVKEIEKQEAKVSAREKSAKDNIVAEEKHIAQMDKSCKDDKTTMMKKEQYMGETQSMFETLKKNDERDEAAFAHSQKKYMAICNGMEINEAGESESLHQQLMNARQEANTAITEMKTANMELQHCQKELNVKEKQLGTDSSDYNRNKASMNQVSKDLENLETKLNKLNFNEERFTELHESWKELHDGIRVDRQKVFEIESRRPNLRFTYRDPETNFNRSRVHGIICKLFEVVDPKFCTALETVAGSRLYNVVVEDDITSKLLLQKGNLQTRTTFIPLNKIRGEKIDNNTVKFAENLVGKDNIHTALSLIKYDPKLHAAMVYIFGGAFICTDMNVAKKVTFHDKIRKKCVTLDGDVTDPGGVLSGGAMQKGTPLLKIIDEVIKLENNVREKENIFRKVDADYKRLTDVKQSSYNPMMQQLELKQMELENVKRCLQQTSHHILQQEVESLRENIAKLTEKLNVCKETEKRCSAKTKELDGIMRDSHGYKERQLKEAEKEMNAMKAQSEKSRKEWQKREQEYEMLNLEIIELKKSIEATLKQIEEAKENVVRLKDELLEIQKEAAEINAELKENRDDLKKEKNEIALKNKEVQGKLAEKEKLVAKNYKLELDVKQCGHDLEKLQQEYKQAQTNETNIANTMQNIDNKNLQRAQEMQDSEADDLKGKIKSASDKHNKLGRTVNSKAQSMFDQEEKRYTTLMKKYKIVKQDRASLLQILEDLDKKKEEAIQLAYTQVKKDFGSIFGSLLPGSSASLAPPFGKTILQGLEVKVNLGGVWKESLTELSGGQRSLVALSLILSMLLFKPAPLYILDEVDAALDLSHTQNIGNMLKSHFKQSQFIIVSLKDGMFNNANVLFRTQFIDGMSNVVRTVNRR